MRKSLGLAVFLGVVSLGGASSAAVTIVGGSGAGECSRAARSGHYDDQSFATCTAAIGMEVLSRRDLAGTYVNRATMLLRRQAWLDASRDLDAAAGIDASLGEIHVNRGAAYLGLRRYRDAVTELDSGLALGTEEPEKAYYNRAMARELTDDIKGAYLDYKKAAELSPKWVEPREALSRFTVRVRN